MVTPATYTLKIIFTGLCALIPTSQDLTVALMNPQSPAWNVKCTDKDHQAALSTRVAYFQKDQPTVPLVTGQDGNQDAWFELKGQSITLEPLTPGRPFSTKACWFRKTQVPHRIVPSHDQDARWSIDGSRVTKDARIRPELLTSPFPGLWAVVTLSQGELRTASVMKGIVGHGIEYLTFEWNASVIQALADQAVVEIPFTWDPFTTSQAPVVFKLKDWARGTTQELKLFPAPGSNTIEVSITNLPKVMLPVYEHSHFHCYCDLVRDKTGCGDPGVANKGFDPAMLVERAGIIAGTGISCPLVTLQR